MSIDDVVERLTGDKDEHNRWVGVYIGILAVLLAVCGMGGGNAAKDSVRAHIEASNTWAFFQSKNIRRSAISLATDDLELMLRTQPNLAPDARKAVEDKIKDYRAQTEKLTKDPERKEGLDELWERGKALEAGARHCHAQGSLFRLEPGAAADRNRAGLRAPDHR